MKFLNHESKVLRLPFALRLIGLIFLAYVLFSLCYYVAYLVFASKQIQEDTPALQRAPVAIVFGAGLQLNGEPSDILKDRLRQASVLYHEEKIQKLFLTGDNSYEYYNEPASMKKFLVEALHVPSEVIVLDYGGRRTFDSCIRAREIWGLEEAILVSQSYHLLRAMTTCHVLGMHVQAYSATRQTYQNETRFLLRELLAQAKAYIDLFIWRPSYLKGDVETDFDELIP